jgi:drug/metabolite transporter (DMT)-like permease
MTGNLDHLSSRPYKKTTVALLLLLSYICLTAGQVSAKLAGTVLQPEAGRETTAIDPGAGGGAGEVGRLAPAVIEALTQSGLRAAQLALIFAVGTYVFFLLRGLLWIFLLRKLKLVLAYPLMSIGYVLVLGVSFLLFKETLTLGKLAGALLLMSGVSLVSIGEVRQKRAADIASAAAEKAAEGEG